MVVNTMRNRHTSGTKAVCRGSVEGRTFWVDVGGERDDDSSPLGESKRRLISSTLRFKGSVVIHAKSVSFRL